MSIKIKVAKALRARYPEASGFQILKTKVGVFYFATIGDEQVNITNELKDICKHVAFCELINILNKEDRV